MGFSNMNDMMKDLNKMLAGGGGLGMQSGITQLKLEMHEYKEMGLNDVGLSDEQLIAAMLEAPILIERPIVVCGTKAALGRPPDDALAMILLDFVDT